MRHIRKVCILLCLFFAPFLNAQINTERVMLMGRNALYYEDYVLSIQRFNMVISAKPYLAEPYFYRGLAKFYLEDYSGAEEDCTSAIERNPFLPDNYRLRGLCRVNLKKYDEAIADYRKLLDIEPKDEGGLHNMVLCHLRLKEYDEAIKGIDQMIRFWPKNSQLYAFKAQAYFAQKDTVAAVACVDKALEVNPYDGKAWNMRAMVLASKSEYKEAEEALNKTILQEPKMPDHYVNRALARYYQRNLRGAMNDYDIAIELDSSNYVGHFNRGLLRAQVGDDNRAIEDFNFVLKREPDNMIALFNRAMMLDNTGDYKGAIRDIDSVIAEYPDFLTGYQFRAEVRRKIGDRNGAERDEFKVMKAQMERRYGNQKPADSKRTRKKNERNIEDYDKLIEEDNTEEEAPIYASEYRGKVQNRKTELEPEPLMVLSYYSANKELRRRVYDSDLERLNRLNVFSQDLLLTTHEEVLTEARVARHFASIKDLTDRIERQPSNSLLFLARSMDYYMVQDFEKALSDINNSIEMDSTLALAYYVRSQIIVKNHEVRNAENKAATEHQLSKWEQEGLQLSLQKALNDCDKALKLRPDMSGCYYNKGNIYLMLRMWDVAIKEYTNAIEHNVDFAEAYYNRGIAHILSGDYTTGVADLSVAGEKGLYKAYNLIKRYSKNPNQEAPEN